MGNLYVADRGYSLIRQINFNKNTVITMAGSGIAGYVNGIGSSANFNSPISIYVNPTGSII